MAKVCSSDSRVYDGQDDESVDEEPDEDGGEVHPELAGHHGHVLHAQDLAGDQEEHADGGKVDDPRGDPHHGLGQAREEVQQRLARLAHRRQRDAQYDWKKTRETLRNQENLST